MINKSQWNERVRRVRKSIQLSLVRMLLAAHVILLIFFHSYLAYTLCHGEDENRNEAEYTYSYSYRHCTIWTYVSPSYPQHTKIEINKVEKMNGRTSNKRLTCGARLHTKLWIAVYTLHFTVCESEPESTNSLWVRGVRIHRLNGEHITNIAFGFISTKVAVPMGNAFFAIARSKMVRVCAVCAG